MAWVVGPKGCEKSELGVERFGKADDEVGVVSGDRAHRYMQEGTRVMAKTEL